MAEPDPFLCPECGWTGEQVEIDRVNGDSKCPVCSEIVEFVE